MQKGKALIQKHECMYWIIPWICIIPFTLRISTDNFYMIATGEYIAKNGIPYTNPFSVVAGLHIVIQNWLYCVLQYWISRPLGLTGIQILSAMQFALFDSICFYTTRSHKCSNPEAGGFIFFANVIMAYIMGCARPAILTTSWLLLIVNAMERYGKEQSLRICVILPAATLATANIQSSNLVFLFCPVVAYVTVVLCKKHKGKKEYQKVALICVMTVISLGCAFINPYGKENVLYLWNSLGHVDAPELDMIAIASPGGVIALCGVIAAIGICVLYAYQIRDQERIDLYPLFILLGFGSLSLSCKRNLIFLIPAFMPVWQEACHIFAVPIKYGYRKVKENRIKDHAVLHVLKIVCSCMSLSVWLGYAVANITPPGTILKQSIYYEDGKMLNYILDREEQPEKIKLFPGSPLMQIYGIKVMLESRNEIYDKPINKKDDLYSEYKSLMDSYEKEDIGKYFNKYQFDYLIAEKGSKLDLYFCMETAYKEVMRTENCVLYQRIGSTDET